MAARTGSAIWTGDLQDGSGRLVVGAQRWEADYSFRSRFTDDAMGSTNPVELLAAAHARRHSSGAGAPAPGRLSFATSFARSLPPPASRCPAAAVGVPASARRDCCPGPVPEALSTDAVAGEVRFFADSPRSTACARC